MSQKSSVPQAAKSVSQVLTPDIAEAQNWLSKRAEDLPDADRDFIGQSMERERKSRARMRRVQALVYVLLVGIIVGLVAVLNQDFFREQWRLVWTIGPYIRDQNSPLH